MMSLNLDLHQETSWLIIKYICMLKVTCFNGVLTNKYKCTSVADPGFPVGGRGPPTWALFGENVCENERIGSHRGGACTRHTP